MSYSVMFVLFGILPVYDISGYSAWLPKKKKKVGSIEMYSRTFLTF